MVVNKAVYLDALDYKSACMNIEKYAYDYASALDLIVKLKDFITYQIIVPYEVSQNVRKEMKQLKDRIKSEKEA